jgi:23S rRNA (adenine2030-N6)-methyltransferase
LKYRHSFHAGNFADTVKHLVLCAILKSLTAKPAPFFFLDTHAGRGRYKVSPDNTEFAAGFGKLREQPDLPAPIAEYVALLESIGAASGRDSPLQFYAGSPLIAAHMMRPEDRAVLFELGIAEAEKLRETMQPFRNVSVQCADGYSAVRSQLPPRERRGLVLIDPPYELQEKEFPLVIAALSEAHKRWASGIFAIWYPIKRRPAVLRWQETLKETGIRKILCVQLHLYPDDSRIGLNGCGMIVVNPPWQLDRTLHEALPALHRLLGGQPRTSGECFWLVPE